MFVNNLKLSNLQASLIRTKLTFFTTFYLFEVRAVALIYKLQDNPLITCALLKMRTKSTILKAMINVYIFYIVN